MSWLEIIGLIYLIGIPVTIGFLISEAKRESKLDELKEYILFIAFLWPAFLLVAASVYFFDFFLKKPEQGKDNG